MLPSPFIASSTTPFSVKDILKLELQQQSQQHQLQLISCLGFSAPSGKPLRSHSPPSCMLAGRESASPIGSGLSEGDDKMSYLHTLAAQARLAESELPAEMFGSPAQSHSAAVRLEPEPEPEEESSKCHDTNVASEVKKVLGFLFFFYWYRLITRKHGIVRDGGLK